MYECEVKRRSHAVKVPMPFKCVDMLTQRLHVLGLPCAPASRL